MEGQLWIQFVDNIPFVGSTQEAVEAVASRWIQHAGSDVEGTRGGPELISCDDVLAAIENSVKLIPDDVRKEVESYKSLSGSHLETTEDTVYAGLEAPPPKRGDHVLNNNLLKIFAKIIDNFLESNKCVHRPTSWRTVVSEGLSEKSQVYQAYKQPMSPEDTQFIMYTAVVRSNVTFYVNGNDEDYGRAVQKLNGKCVEYIYHLYIQSGDKINKLKKELDVLVENFIKSDVYVDKVAETKWLKENPREKKHYQDVKGRVAVMLRRLLCREEVPKWVSEMRPYLHDT